jgi:hypothetical protein
MNQTVRQELIDVLYDIYLEERLEDRSVGIFKAGWTDLLDVEITINSPSEGNWSELKQANKEEFVEKLINILNERG